jgi:hypothetical protein
VLLIPLIIAGAILSGYGVEITRRTIRGQLDGLPEWDNWGELIVDGLKVIVIGIVYALPAILVSLCLSVPAGIMAEDAEALSTMLSLLASCLSLFWAIVISIVLPAAIAFFAAEDDLSAAFRFSEIFTLVRENLSTYLITFIMSWVAQLIGGLGSLVCGIGWLVTAPYGTMVTGHLYGQAYVEAKAGAAPPFDAEAEEDIF